jgi:uncharacterized membrane protein YhaH (DUF805 family)
MFKNPFSFEGRIRRLEYGISFIIYLPFATIVSALSSKQDGTILALLYIPFLWFLFAQGAKRCHDTGKSGWWQLLPLYSFLLIFQKGIPEANEYGENPKISEIQEEGVNEKATVDLYTDTDDIAIGTKCFTDEAMTIPYPDGEIITHTQDKVSILGGVVVSLLPLPGENNELF